jgi:hypothetical protein
MQTVHIGERLRPLFQHEKGASKTRITCGIAIFQQVTSRHGRHVRYLHFGGLRAATVGDTHVGVRRATVLGDREASAVMAQLGPVGVAFVLEDVLHGRNKVVTAVGGSFRNLITRSATRAWSCAELLSG